MEDEFELVSKFDKLNSQVERNFFGVYEIIRVVNAGGLKGKTLWDGPKVQPCRYCLKTSPEVSFRNDAHLLSRLLGNTHLLSGSECDSCNTRFSGYESAFANYMAAYRPFSQAFGRRRPPKYEVIDHDDEGAWTAVSVTSLPEERTVVIGTTPEERDRFYFDKRTKLLSVAAIRKPHRPLSVLKALIKMGYALIEPEDLSKYSGTRKILENDTHDADLSSSIFCNVFIARLHSPPVFTEPCAFLCTKKRAHADSRYPNTVFVLLTMNHIFQIFLPYDQRDQHLYGGEAHLLRFPALLPPYQQYDGCSYEYDFARLDGLETVHAEEHTFKVVMN